MLNSSSEREIRGRVNMEQVPDIAIDYDRRVFNLFGLPIDALSKDEVLNRVAFCATTARRCHLATPNANILRVARGDPEFRDALLSADLSTLDGMPLVMLARAMGLPASQVTGADLFELLQRGRRGRLRAFFFGGDEATSQRLVETLNDEQSGVVCVGARSPGFGAIDDATTRDAIAEINNARADLLSVSIGARNGVIWIVRNERRLRTPVVANLGAVIHFATGALPRAPVWMRRSGLEWLWRIAAEPSLVSRYARDALTLASVSLFLMAPSMVLALLAKGGAGKRGPRIAVASDERGATIALSGAWRGTDLAPLRQALMQADAAGGAMTFDLSDLTWIDAEGLGLILLAYGGQRRRGRDFFLHASSPWARAALSTQGCGFLLSRAASRREASAPI